MEPITTAAIIGGGMAAGGLAGSLLGKKKAKPIDISQQLAQVKGTYDRNRGINLEAYNQLQPITDQYAEDSAKARAGLSAAFGKGKEEYLGATEDLTNKAQSALRANLYSDTFTGLPDTMRAVREASAAGGGLDSGAYQQAVQNVGVDTARTLAGGERDIQLSGMQNLQEARTRTFDAFNQLSSKLSDMEMQSLTQVMDSGREDLVRRATVEMGLNEAEAQAVIDLMNFKASGKLAADMGEDANRQALYNSLIGGGMGLIGKGMTSTPAAPAKGA